VTRYDSDARPADDARGGAGQNELGETVVPMEAVISEKDSRKLHAQAELTEQVIEERQKRAREPVRMEGLKPLPDAMRAGVPGHGVIPGGPGALDAAPGMRRTIPAPYQRPRISIDHHGKTWGYARADTVSPGDIVVDFGKIEEAYERVVHKNLDELVDGDIKYDWATPPYITGDQVAVGTDWVMVNIAGEVKVTDPDEQLRVFRVQEEFHD
jgi:hypothetical protein